MISELGIPDHTVLVLKKECQGTGISPRLYLWCEYPKVMFFTYSHSNSRVWTTRLIIHQDLRSSLRAALEVTFIEQELSSPGLYSGSKVFTSLSSEQSWLSSETHLSNNLEIFVPGLWTKVLMGTRVIVVHIPF